MGVRRATRHKSRRVGSIFVSYSRDSDVCRLYLSLEKEDEEKTVETVANDVEDGRNTTNCPELSHE